jgi:hypothetical protein
VPHKGQSQAEYDRRVRDLAESSAAQLGGWSALSDAQAASIRRAAELKALAEKELQEDRERGAVEAKEVQGWFGPYPGAKLDLEACDKLARDLRAELHRHENRKLELRGPIPLKLLKDASPAEELRARQRISARFRAGEIV